MTNVLLSLSKAIFSFSVLILVCGANAEEGATRDIFSETDFSINKKDMFITVDGVEYNITKHLSRETIDCMYLMKAASKANNRCVTGKALDNNIYSVIHSLNADVLKNGELSTVLKEQFGLKKNSVEDILNILEEKKSGLELSINFKEPAVGLNYKKPFDP